MATYELDGYTFEVRRMTVGVYERAMLAVSAADKIPAGDDPSGVARLKAACAGMLEILKPSNPELTLDELADLVPMSGIDEEFGRLMEAAGRKRAKPGEAASP